MTDVQKYTMSEFAKRISDELLVLANAIPDTGQEAASIGLRIMGVKALGAKTLKELLDHATESSGLHSYWKRDMTWTEAVEYFLNVKLTDLTD